jgi:hypothetical protein
VHIVRRSSENIHETIEFIGIPRKTLLINDTYAN